MTRWFSLVDAFLFGTIKIGCIIFHCPVDGEGKKRREIVDMLSLEVDRWIVDTFLGGKVGLCGGGVREMIERRGDEGSVYVMSQYYLCYDSQ